MARTLPEKIVAVVSALAEDLADWCVDGRDKSLAVHEQAVLERVRKVLPVLLGAVVEASTSGLDPRLARQRAACPTCRRKVKPHQARRRQVLTVCGAVDLDRPWYHCDRCGHGWSVVETTLGVAERARLSAGLTEWVARLGAAAPFREAAEVLAALTGLELGAETVRRHTERVGTALAEAEDAASTQVAKTGEPAEALDPAPGLLVVQTDGAMVPYLDGWHEVKLGLVAGWADGALRAPSYVAAREPAERFGARLATEAARRGALEIVGWKGGLSGRALGILREVTVLGDGAAWIWNLAGEHFGERAEIVDFYHACEHLWTVARALYGADTSRGKTWAEARIGDLFERGAGPVLQALGRAEAPGPEAAEVLRQERGYFRTNADRMAYPAFRAAGLPIGSGAVESLAKHLVQQRMKRAGMRWSEAGGRGMLALLAHRASGRPLPTPVALPARRLTPAA